MAQAFVSLSFDDGWKSIITHALPLLDRHGLPATFYIITDRLDDTVYPQYMNADDLRTLASRGHEIGSHTRGHKHLPDLPIEEVWSEVRTGMDDLRALGFSPRTFAYPFGEWTPQVVKQVREAGFFGARSIEDGLNDENVNHLLLRTFVVHADYPPEQIIARIDEAVRRGQWPILSFHQVEPTDALRTKGWIYGVTPETLEKVLAYLKGANTPVFTVEKGMERMIEQTLAR